MNEAKQRAQVKISASLLAADGGNLRSEIQRVEQAGVDSFHLDVMDGHYVQNYAFSLAHLELVREISRRPIQLHLEISNPEALIARAPDLTGTTVIVQVNSCRDREKIVESISQRGGRVGLGLNPDHGLEFAGAWLESADMLLLLAVQPGFGGQTFQIAVLEKIKRARKLIEEINPAIELAVDGGIKRSNALQVYEKGADNLIIGTGLFDGGDIGEKVLHIRQQCKKAFGVPEVPS